MKAFVTGGAGFIGSHIVETLLADPASHVTVLDNLTSGRMRNVEPYLNDPRFRFIKGDLLDAGALEAALDGYDAVFHFAANSDIARGANDPEVDFRQSVVATFGLLQAMRRTGVSAIVFASGSGVYGEQGDVPTPEIFGPLLPISMYGAGKVAVEAMLSAFAHLFDMRALIFRFANVVGARQTHGVVFDFIRKMRAKPKRLEVLGDGRQSKPYIHVTDVVDAILFVNAKCTDRVSLYNVATDDDVTVRWIAEQVIDSMAARGVEPVFLGGDRGWKGDVPIVRFDLKKIHRLGWHAKLDSRAAVRRSISELLEEVGGP